MKMEICKNQQIHNFCHPNAIMTLKEYLMDYASEETQKVGNALIEKEIEKIESEEIKNKVKENLQKIENGERNFKF